MSRTALLERFTVDKKGVITKGDLKGFPIYVTHYIEELNDSGYCDDHYKDEELEWFEFDICNVERVEFPEIPRSAMTVLIGKNTEGKWSTWKLEEE